MVMDKHTNVYKCTKLEAEDIYIYNRPFIYLP